MWCTPVISATRSLRQEHHKLENTLGYKERSCFSTNPSNQNNAFLPKSVYVCAQRKSVNITCSFSRHKTKKQQQPQKSRHLTSSWKPDALSLTPGSALLGDSWPWEKLIILQGSKALLRKLGGKYLVTRKFLSVSGPPESQMLYPTVNCGPSKFFQKWQTLGEGDWKRNHKAFTKVNFRALRNKTKKKREDFFVFFF